MATYYIDHKNGDDALDGLSPETARKNYQDILLKDGDTVLFKRGSFYRDKLYAVKEITYSAYGEGDLPTFCGSTDVSGEDDWVLTETENVWKCVKPINGDVGNIAFNDDECTATFCWELADLKGQGYFYDSKCMLGDCFKNEYKEPTFYLYSVKNPAKFYSHIEAISFNTRELVKLDDGMTFENIRFLNSGVHGIGGTGTRITARNCEFKNIGGCAWSGPLKIRFGNAFEVWEKGDDILVENCYFKNVYDSCVTHQGPGEDTKPTERFICRGCTFDTYGMAAFEYRDKMPINSSFTNNICLNAGCGFAMLGETNPRSSEIYPQPMGHHIFMWRIDGATKGGSLEIKNNYFGPAPVGAAVYSIISKEAEAQVVFDENTYTPNDVLLNRWGGENFNDLSLYKQKTGQDKNSKCVKE